jgi:hypothetical protein
MKRGIGSRTVHRRADTPPQESAEIVLLPQKFQVYRDHPPVMDLVVKGMEERSLQGFLVGGPFRILISQYLGKILPGNLVDQSGNFVVQFRPFFEIFFPVRKKHFVETELLLKHIRLKGVKFPESADPFKPVKIADIDVGTEGTDRGEEAVKLAVPLPVAEGFYQGLHQPIDPLIVFGQKNKGIDGHATFLLLRRRSPGFS